MICEGWHCTQLEVLSRSSTVYRNAMLYLESLTMLVELATMKQAFASYWKLFAV